MAGEELANIWTEANCGWLGVRPGEWVDGRADGWTDEQICGGRVIWDLGNCVHRILSQQKTRDCVR